MNVEEWLRSLGLEQYAEQFAREGIMEADLPMLSMDDLKEVGVVKFAHRKEMHRSISALISKSPLGNLVEDLPLVIAVPLHEYIEEDHPILKLWAACNVLELLLRFLMVTMVADFLRDGRTLNKSTEDTIWKNVDTPTLGQWWSMARALAKSEDVYGSLIPEARELVSVHLKPLLDGTETPARPETSIVSMRNSLVHGGGISCQTAERLLAIWQTPFETALASMEWMEKLSLVARDHGSVIELRGLNQRTISAQELISEKIEGSEDNDSVWLVRGEAAISLWPIAQFGKPSSMSQIGKVPVPQIYSRRYKLQLELTPIPSDEIGQSVVKEPALKAFRKLFRLDERKISKRIDDFKFPDEEEEIRNVASQTIGRDKELLVLRTTISEKDTNLIWFTGRAGAGKSFLVSKLASELLDEYENSSTLVLAYRFNGGEGKRCSRTAFEDFVSERLKASEALLDGIGGGDTKTVKGRLKSALGRLKQDRKVIFILDGLDELHLRDPQFVEEIIFALRYPRIVWFCSGRPEATLVEAFSLNQASQPFVEGLPPMDPNDVRSMLLENTTNNKLRKKLLRNDQETNGDVINPFIDLIVKHADGLPIYVQYVITDVLHNKYHDLDGTEILPETLHAYHEELLGRLGISDVQSLLAPVTALLATAYEPLTENEIHTFLEIWGLVSGSDEDKVLVNNSLSAIAMMLRSAPKPEGDDGVILFHTSLREHILTSDAMAGSVRRARRVFGKAALAPDSESSVQNYLYRHGIDHLIDNDDVGAARERLLDLKHLSQLAKLSKEPHDIFSYWLRIGDTDPGAAYVNAVHAFDEGTLTGQELAILRYISNLCSISGWYKAGVKVSEISLRLHEKMLDPEHSGLLHSLNQLATTLGETGDFVAAEPIMRRVLETSDLALGSEHPGTLASIQNLTTLLAKMGDYAAAEPLMRRVLEVSERTLGPEHPDTLGCINNLATLLADMGDYAAAEPLMRGGLETRERTLGSEHPDTLASVNNLALLNRSMSNFEAAEPLMRRVLENRERTLGPEHPDTLGSINNLAVLLADMGDYAAAEPLTSGVLAASERTLGPEHPDTLGIIHNLAHLLADMGDYAAAELLYRRALKVRERTLGTEHPDTLRSVNNLGALLTNMGDFEAAELLYRRALEARERALGLEHPDTLSSVNNLGVLLTNLGDFEAAELLFHRALEAYDRTLGPEHPATLQSINNLGLLLNKVGGNDAG
jgi:tetratricopeptide (TPR) repeat protein